MLLTDPAAEDELPGWRPLLRTVRDIAEHHLVRATWKVDDGPTVKLAVPPPVAPPTVGAALAVIGATMNRTCDQCGGLGRPVGVEGVWRVRCGGHDPAAPFYSELWEGLNQGEWFNDAEVGMVRVAEMTAAQRQDAIARLSEDPVAVADQVERHALFQAARRRDWAAFDEALQIPTDDEDEARRMVEESPLMRVLRRGEVDRATDAVIYRWGRVLDRLAMIGEGEDDVITLRDDTKAREDLGE
ncbi:hypothetical protein KZX45_16450 [Georgenia sp. EYE_87]|uniref:hypothetical protein n=1 Tax=Georgenia sp. EYE_87 TaxID=2853448 RepID=UPI002005818E|nr:hypothetical protein [Georgenia sp. EYE_87]MCK6212135.1 hypothetical protein [Georgenia sp. EYE_87]